MRDAHRMKEKYDLSLDNRQVVSLLIGSIVVLGAVFVLGVVVGKNLAGTHAAAQAPDLLSALDAQANALEQEQVDPPLTFQDELTAKKPVAPPPVEATPVVAVEPKPAEKPAPPEQEEPARVAETVKPPEPKASETRSADVSPAKEEKKDVTVAVSGQVEPAQVPTRTNDAGIKDAIARAAQKPQETSADGTWTLQLSASQSRDEADRFAAKLRDRGYAPYIIEAEVAGKGTWYRVRMGRFGNKDAAQRYLQDFRRETQMEAFVATVQ